MAHSHVSPPAYTAPDQAKAEKQSNGDDVMKAEQKALGILAENQSLSVQEIADHVGCSRQHLYKCERFIQARRAFEGWSKDQLPRGEIDQDGNLEAW